ncbi:MAG: hypothetical protein M1816_004815 [Peltula sp. TS41687]|nr:MAG: hypothetical protein M1816_004815 [Peltula sp. TS41687]
MSQQASCHTHRQNEPTTADAQAPTPNEKKKATVIGLYGVPGAVKTYLLNRLKQELGYEQFAFYEGS